MVADSFLKKTCGITSDIFLDSSETIQIEIILNGFLFEDTSFNNTIKSV
jgi:hypothetical protein